jgi:hypothetical protein
VTKPASPQPLARILAADATIAAWHLRARTEAELTTAVRRHLPRALAERVHVAEVANATLTLATSTGTVAAVVTSTHPGPRSSESARSTSSCTQPASSPTAASASRVPCCQGARALSPAR